MIFVGDVHGKYDEYLKIIARHKSSVQVGDMGFNYKHLDGIDPGSHTFIGGNHDNWDIIHECPNYLGRFGALHIGRLQDAFFVSGAYSIDQWHRTEGKSWWRNEELSYSESADCLSLYVMVQPEVVISHDCPNIAAQKMFNKSDNTATRQLLSGMLARWKPKLWLFGHWHESKSIIINNTRFVCLAELETFDSKEFFANENHNR
jgi:hypothetical protein